jgi:hypothetical protein
MVGHTAYMRREAYRILVWNLRVRDDLEDIELDERIILKCATKKWDGEMD